MQWRRLRLNWSYAVGELLIVIAGVLIALAIGEWNSARLERHEERAAVARILQDLAQDVADFDFKLDRLAAKEESLLRVRDVLMLGAVGDPAGFLQDVIIGADFGWNQGGAMAAAYTDLLGAGRLGIIRNADVRLSVSRYYEYLAGELPRMDERETAYPQLSYALVPRQYQDPEPFLVEERILERGLTQGEMEAIAAAVLRSDLGNYVIAEINLARFIRGITVDSKDRALELIERLEAYRQSL